METYSEKLETVIKWLRKQVGQANTERDAVRSETTSVNLLNESLRLENKRLRAELDETNGVCESLKNIHEIRTAGIEGLTTKNKSLQEQLDKAECECNMLQERADELKIENEELKEYLKKKYKEIIELEQKYDNELFDKDMEYRDLRKECDALHNACQQPKIQFTDPSGDFNRLFADVVCKLGELAEIHRRSKEQP